MKGAWKRSKRARIMDKTLFLPCTWARFLARPRCCFSLCLMRYCAFRFNRLGRRNRLGFFKFEHRSEYRSCQDQQRAAAGEQIHPFMEDEIRGNRSEERLCAPGQRSKCRRYMHERDVLEQIGKKRAAQRKIEHEPPTCRGNFSKGGHPFKQERSEKGAQKAHGALDGAKHDGIRILQEFSAERQHKGSGKGREHGKELTAPER